MEFRHTTLRDVAGVVALQRACFPPPFPEELLWTGHHVETHLSLFPEGQFVCVHDGQVVGCCTNMLASRVNWDSHLPWEEATGGLSLTKHEPAGKVLYGIDVSVHPNHRRQGIARGLYAQRFRLVRETDLSLYGTVSRMPGYASSSFSSPDEYASCVTCGTVNDPTMTPLMHMGLTYCGVVSEYMDDAESGNFGAVWEWTP